MKKELKFRIILWVFLLIVYGLCLWVTLLCISKFNKGKELDYGDTWRKDGLGLGGFLKENFDAMVTDGYGGRVEWKTNFYGFRNNYEVRQNPDNGIIRIISMGDSFTVGYRIRQESTFSALLEKYFNSKSNEVKYEILISCIEDSVYGLFYLAKYGIIFKPKVIILGLTLGNDIAESYERLDQKGRFVLNDEDGSVRMNVNPPQGRFEDDLKKLLIPEECLANQRTVDRSKIPNRGESIISCSPQRRSPRLFDNSNGLGIYLKNAPLEINEAYSRLFRVLKGFKILTDKLNIEFVIVLFPQRFQIQEEDWFATTENYRLKDDCFDLWKPNNLILDFCKKNNIICIDPTFKMIQIYNRERKSLYFRLGDMHLNALGNKALYESIKDEIYDMIRSKHVEK